VPLDNHLCRLSVDDECFVYTDSIGNSMCVVECPIGSEEGFNNGYSTGICIQSECSTIALEDCIVGTNCVVYSGQCLMHCPNNYETDLQNSNNICGPKNCEERIPFGNFKDCSLPEDETGSICSYKPPETVCGVEPCPQECFSECPSNYDNTINEMGINVCGPISCENRVIQENGNCRVWEDIGSDIECFPIGNNACGTSCPYNVDPVVINNMTSCVVRGCSDRIPTESGSCKMNGDTTVCKSIVALNKCFTTCPDNTVVNDTSGTCDLKTCGERAVTSRGTCLVYEGEECYVSNGVCVVECPDFSSIINTELQICAVEECESRVPINERCSNGGSDLCSYYVDMEFLEEEQPVGVCAYCPASLFESFSGRCYLKTCLARQKNDSASLVCGPDCYYSENNCNVECPAYSEPNESGICGEPSTNCSLREPQNVPVNKCGTECVYNPVTSSCSQSCQQFYIRNPTTNECEVAICEQRLPDSSLTSDICGNGCVAINSTSCADSCLEWYEVNEITKVCEITVTCNERTYSPNADLKCGIGCVYDPDSDRCAENCPPFHSPNLLDGICRTDQCVSRIPIINASLECGPYPCYRSNAVCVTSCPSRQAANKSGVCIPADKSDLIYVGGSGASDTMVCGENLVIPCESLDFAIHSRLNLTALSPTVNILGQTTLTNDCDITGLRLSSQNEQQIIIVPKSVSLLFNASRISQNLTITNIIFNITSSAVHNSILSGFSSYSGVLILLENVSIIYLPVLNAPHLLFNGISTINLINVKIEKRISTLRTILNNADTNICSLRSNSSAISLINSNISMNNCEIRNVDTGAIVISGGSINVQSVIFTNNYVSKPTSFPNIRHNVFATNGAIVNIESMTVDSEDSFFVYGSDNVRISGLDIPLFVPYFESISPSLLSEGLSTTFAFSGRSFYPCGLMLIIARDAEGNTLVGEFPTSVHDENTSTVTLENTLFDGTDNYYAYFVYGPNYQYRTKSVRFFEAGPSSKGKNNLAGLVVGVVIAFIAVVIVIVVVMIFVIWRYRLRKRWSEESKSEQMGISHGESTKVCSLI
jgi:hypothetical protein